MSRRFDADPYVKKRTKHDSVLCQVALYTGWPVSNRTKTQSLKITNKIAGENSRMVKHTGTVVQMKTLELLNSAASNSSAELSS